MKIQTNLNNNNNNSKKKKRKNDKEVNKQISSRKFIAKRIFIKVLSKFLILTSKKVLVPVFFAKLLKSKSQGHL